MYDIKTISFFIFMALAVFIRVYQIANGCGLTLECEMAFDGLITTVIFVSKYFVAYCVFCIIFNKFKK
jgi:hypothetical protein